MERDDYNISRMDVMSEGGIHELKEMAKLKNLKIWAIILLNCCLNRKTIELRGMSAAV